MIFNSFSEFSNLLPEILLTLVICLLIMADMFIGLDESKKTCSRFALLGCCGALFLLLSETDVTYSSMLIHDNLALFFRILFVLGALFSVLLTMRSDEINHSRYGEYLSLLLGATLGAMLIAGANNYLLFVLAFETLSLCSYVLAGYLKHQKDSAEASAKYLIFGAISSAIMLFGISYIYGLSQTLQIDSSITKCLQQFGANDIAITLSFILVLAGLCFKIAALPFHFWCPDVYQGSPTSVAAFLSVVSKGAGFAALMRFGSVVIEQRISFVGLHYLFGILAVLTMTYGNLAALKQTNIKRLLAYSSIAHAGYLLLGLAVLSSHSLTSMLFYLVVYLFMNLGAFFVILVFIRETKSAELSSFSGLAYKAPILFSCLFICLISLTGIPPTAGFAGKFLIFNGLVEAMFISPNEFSTFYLSLAIIGVLNSVVSLFYYLKIAKVMVFEQVEQEQNFSWSNLDITIAISLCVPVLLLINFGPLFNVLSTAFEQLSITLN